MKTSEYSLHSGPRQKKFATQIDGLEYKLYNLALKIKKTKQS